MKQKHNKFRHFAVADLGSAALRLDIYSWNGPPNTSLKLENKVRCLPRLGKLQQTRISMESLSEVEEELTKFREKTDRLNNLKIAAVCTAFMRKATNADEIRKKLSLALGSPFKILSGDEEATLIAKGIFTFEKNLPRELLLLDIGGGSSEISITRSGSGENNMIAGDSNPALFEPHSLNLGALCISELLPGSFEQITPEQIRSARTLIQEKLHLLIPVNSPINTLLGSSGTIRALGNLFNKRNADEDSSHANIIPSEFVSELLSLLQTLPEEELNNFIASERHRKDLLIGGLIILDEVVRHFSVKNIRITDYSLRHGVLRELLESEEGTNLKLDRPFFHVAPAEWKVE